MATVFELKGNKRTIQYSLPRTPTMNDFLAIFGVDNQSVLWKSTLRPRLLCLKRQHRLGVVPTRGKMAYYQRHDKRQQEAVRHFISEECKNVSGFDVQFLRDSICHLCRLIRQRQPESKDAKETTNKRTSSPPVLSPTISVNKHIRGRSPVTHGTMSASHERDSGQIACYITRKNSRGIILSYMFLSDRFLKQSVVSTPKSQRAQQDFSFAKFRDVCFQKRVVKNEKESLFFDSPGGTVSIDGQAEFEDAMLAAVTKKRKQMTFYAYGAEDESIRRIGYTSLDSIWYSLTLR